MSMKQLAIQERRKHTRHLYSTNLRFRREDGKALPARSVDISSGGMLLNVLAHQDLFPGQTITLDLDSDDVFDVFPDVYLPCSHVLQATIIRIERGRLSSNGYMSIAVQFNHELNAHDTAYFE
ncbi:MAG: PilZ domain-containing protein [Phycisphaerae bacterium]|nr:PilZ domain-containing protein [Phycisphaerae bacterium]